MPASKPGCCVPSVQAVQQMCMHAHTGMRTSCSWWEHVQAWPCMGRVVCFSGSQLPVPKQCPNVNWPLTGEMLALMGPSGSGKSR